jgi:hypothetical protein
MSIVINKNETGHELAKEYKVNSVLCYCPKTIIYWQIDLCTSFIGELVFDYQKKVISISVFGLRESFKSLDFIKCWAIKKMFSRKIQLVFHFYF